jgi:hypothetical protein
MLLHTWTNNVDEPTACKELDIQYTGSIGCEYQIWGPIDVEDGVREDGVREDGVREDGT